MLVLLAILVTIIGGLHIVTGVRAVGVVMLAVPLIALGWVAMQNQGRGPLKQAASRASAYVAKLHVYRSELILLVMAGFIGTIGLRLLSPVVAASGFDLTALPGWLILIALVWVIPLTGLIGMNPILSVSLMAPLLPARRRWAHADRHHRRPDRRLGAWRGKLALHGDDAACRRDRKGKPLARRAEMERRLYADLRSRVVGVGGDLRARLMLSPPRLLRRTRSITHSTICLCRGNDRRGLQSERVDTGHEIAARCSSLRTRRAATWALQRLLV